jgi:hypothetical protein
MPTYTVHAPPATKGDSEPERFLFLRDGFHFWAFAAPLLWLLVYRQWLALLAYFVVTTALVGGLVLLGAHTAAIVAAAFCISLLLGFEAASIRRWKLRRRGWTMLGFVVGEDQEMAEQRFFARWAERGPAPAAEPSAPNTLPRTTPSVRRDVIGLFPQPGAPR